MYLINYEGTFSHFSCFVHYLLDKEPVALTVYL